MGADDLIANGQPVAIIENHTGDSFANVYSNARNSYYNPSGVPTAYFDGLNAVIGGDHTQSMYSDYLPRVTSYCCSFQIYYFCDRFSGGN